MGARHIEFGTMRDLQIAVIPFRPIQIVYVYRLFIPISLTAAAIQLD